MDVNHLMKTADLTVCGEIWAGLEPDGAVHIYLNVVDDLEFVNCSACNEKGR